MKQFVCACLALLVAVAFAGAPARAAGKIRVLTTVRCLAAIASDIGGDRVEADSLSEGKGDPHFIQAKPSYMTKAARADLFLRVGMELEIGYESLILEGSRNPRIAVGAPGHLDLSGAVEKLEVPTGTLDRSMGDVHPQGNPHYWLSPCNGRLIGRQIRDRLKQLDPAGAADYDRNCAAFERGIDAAMFGAAAAGAFPPDTLWAKARAGGLADLLSSRGITPGGWSGRLLPYAGAKIVTYHRSLPYFARDFALDIVDTIEPKPGIPPSPRHVADLIRTIQSGGVKLLVQETFYSQDALRTLASKTGAGTAVIPNDVAGPLAPGAYAAMIGAIVDRTAAGLAGK